MGLYPINCPTCGKGHLWFSGSFDTRCPDCININPIVVTANLLPCGHKPCELKGCKGCVQHCGKALRLIRNEKEDATKKTKKRKGDAK